MDVEHSAHSASSVWGRLSQYLPLFLLSIWVCLYWPTFEGLYARWVQWDEGMAHGLPVVLLFVYLLYKSLPWVPLPGRNVTWAVSLAGLVLASLAWYVFHAVNVTILEQLILLPLMILILAAVFGLRQVFSHRLLLLFPLFAIPIWDYFNAPLLFMSSAVVGELVQIAGMPALIEGNSIFIPHGHILIADGCSGLRYFVIALTLGYLIAYLNNYSERQLSVVLAAAAMLGLCANWIRIFILIVIGYQTEMKSPLMADHEYFGWVLFAIICLPAIYFAPVIRNHKEPLTDARPLPKSFMSVTPLPLIALAIGPTIALAVELEPKKSEWEPIFERLGLAALKREMPSPVTSPENGYSESALLTDYGVYVQVDQYQRASSSEKLVPHIVRLYDSENWLKNHVKDLSLADHHAKASVLRHKARDRSVAQLQWFEVGEYTATTVAQAKLWQIPAVLQGQNHFQIVTLQTSCRNTDCAAALTKLTKTAEALELKDGK